MNNPADTVPDGPAHRTRIKICGLTREADVLAAVQAGADAVGFVLYEPSPRYVSARRAGELARLLPAFVTPVLLVVNAGDDAIQAGLDAVPTATLQFHGDETPADCERAARPYLRAARIPADPVATGFDLLEYVRLHAHAQAILLDAQVDGYGGGGKAFDWTLFNWSRIRQSAASRLVLSGGLTPANVADGILQVRPWAVDVSSGVEISKGIKDALKIQSFVAAVRAADEQLARLSHHV